MPNTKLCYSACLGCIKNALFSPQVREELENALSKHTIAESISFKVHESYDTNLEVNSSLPLDQTEQVIISTFIRGYLACLDPELQFIFL